MLGIDDAIKIGAIILIIVEIFMIFKKVSIWRNLVFLTFGLYIVLVIGVTLFPIHFQEDPIPGLDYAYNFIPFQSILSSFRDGLRSTLRAVGGNVVMFMPLGVLLPILSRKNNKVWRCLILIFCCSVAIELAQYLIGLGVGYRYRNVDVDDLLLNTLGGMIGFGMYQLIPRAWKKPFEQPE